MKPSTLESSLGQVLVGAGLSLRALRAADAEVVLFGSRAAGLSHSASDWDVLVVSDVRPRARSLAGLDLVWIPKSSTATPKWWASELAGHVENFGVWIVGTRRRSARLDLRFASLAKWDVICDTARVVSSRWSALSEPFRLRHAGLLRRDIQRYLLMRVGTPVPPSAVLDSKWSACRRSERREILRGVANRIECSPELLGAAVLSHDMHGA
jgi:predicted nucleotidyltransferase